MLPFYKLAMARPTQFTLLSIVLVVGICAGRAGFSIDPSWLIFLALIIALMALFRSRFVFPALVVALLLLGIWRGFATDFNRSYAAQFVDQKVLICGTVSDDPGTDKYGNYSFELADVQVNGYPLGYPVRIKSLSTGVQRGYQVAVEGKLKPAKGIVSLQVSYAKVEVLNTNQDWLEKLRQKFIASVRSNIPPSLSGFGIGLLVGAKSHIPGDLQDDMSAVGLSHVVAASGYNLTILVIAMQRILAGVSIFAATAAAGWLIAAFMVVSGFSAAIFRASLVSTVSMLTGFYGNKVNPITLITLPAALTLAWKPDFLFRDLGWQLSFTAFFGVLVLAPLIEERWVQHPSMLKSLLIESSCAHIMTLPLIMWRFENLSIIAPITNLFVLPFIPLAMLLTFLSGLAGMFLPSPIAAFVSMPATGLLGYCIAVAQWFAAIRIAQVEQGLTGFMVAAFYIIILLFSWLLYKRAKNFEVRNSLLAGVHISSPFDRSPR